MFPLGLGVTIVPLEQGKSFNYFHMVTEKPVKVTATLVVVWSVGRSGPSCISERSKKTAP